MPAVSSPEIPRPTASLGRSVRSTWTYTLGSIVFILVVLHFMLLSFAASTFTAKNDAVSGLLLLALVLAVALQVRYCWFLRAGLGGGLPRPVWTTAMVVTSGAVWVLGLITSDAGWIAAIPLWLAVSLVASLLPTRTRWLTVAAGVLSLLAFAAIRHFWMGQSDSLPEDSASRMLLAYSAGMPLLLISSLWWWRVVVELDRHRVMAGELAVAQERLRFAADLHDIQGHHLQVIALKSELAERLLDSNPEAARENIHETRLIAKQALEETRSLVAGYRETSLADELENAREVLTAAGADCELTLETLPADPAAQQALAMTVREATTNILRHSEATHATISLTSSEAEATLTIRNNGLNGTPSSMSLTAGTGLLGLRRRLETSGGTLETTLETGHFELQARIPPRGIPA
ncbi:sensor histidine kinase [Arthrobacter sp. N199823]|uniref:sensor histidine kinase n=1 Tax=Arthrobacter sp. N199823 TaxID=2058895 RepID=UPI000CE41C26|nr:histidine kinase [Arthrobacter sp. N199823]